MTLDRVYSSPLYRVGTLVGLAVALITAPLALPPVQDALFGKDVKLTIQIEREIPAFDVNKKFPELSVIYQGRDLTAEDIGLAVSRIRIANTGDVSISESNISRTDPIGVRIRHGKVLGLVGMAASSTHLARRSLPTVVDNDIKISNNIIMDPHDFVQLDILVLKPNQNKLSFYPLGKVEGLKEIGLTKFDTANIQQSFVWSVFGGNVSIQLTRLLAYFIFGVIIIAFLVAVGIQWGELKARLRRGRRQKLCARIRPLLPEADSDLWIVVSSLYQRAGIAGLRSLARHLHQANFQKKPPVEGSREALHWMPEPPARKGESKPRYIKKALDRKLGGSFLGNYVIESASRIDVDLLDTLTRENMIDLIQNFERKIEETAAEAGIRPEYLEKESVDLRQDVIFDTSYEIMTMDSQRRRIVEARENKDGQI